MNLRELPRYTLPTLPSPGEKDQRKVNEQFIACVQNLFKRDEDKEKRLRKREEQNTAIAIPITRDIVFCSGLYTVTSFYNDKIIVCNSAVGFPIYFPSAVGSGKMIIIKNFGTATVNAISDGTDLIDGAAVQYIYTGEGIVFIDYGVGGWLVA
jgi:hypothetical protein